MRWNEIGFHDLTINQLNRSEFIGIEFVLEQIKKHGIWMVLKCQTISGSGYQIDTFLLAPDQSRMFRVMQGLALQCMVLSKTNQLL